MSSDTDHGRGQVKDNAMAALVTSKVYRAKAEKPKKGKGSFKRKAKHKGRENRPYFLQRESRKNNNLGIIALLMSIPRLSL